MNYYERLCVSQNASEEEIIKSFRTLAKQYHPDINKAPNAKQEFIDIFEAYSILKDTSKRKVYDTIISRTEESKQNSSDTSNEYNEWKDQANKKASYYSDKNFDIFSEEVLSKIKDIGKFTKKILLYFGLLIVIGLFGNFIMRPILLSSIEFYVSPNTSLDQRATQSVIEDNKIESEESHINGYILPIPLKPLLDGWKRIYIENIGTIDLPPTMEIQSGKYKEIIDPIKPTVMKSMGLSSSTDYDIVIQQNGLNEFNTSGFQKYARVMINTDIGENEEFESLTFDINQFTASDILELDKLFKTAAEQSFDGKKSKLIQWNLLKLEIINGMSCIHISYVRQLDDNPSVIVNIYKFQNIKKMHTLTLSYREAEKDYWIEYFPIILESFRIEEAK